MISSLGMKSSKQITAINFTIILKITNFNRIFAMVNAFNLRASGNPRSILGKREI